MLPADLRTDLKEKQARHEGELTAALRLMRARWHIENTAFHQWGTQWNLAPCYRHTNNAIHAVMHIWR